MIATIYATGTVGKPFVYAANAEGEAPPPDPAQSGRARYSGGRKDRGPMRRKQDFRFSDAQWEWLEAKAGASGDISKVVRGLVEAAMESQGDEGEDL